MTNYIRKIIKEEIEFPKVGDSLYCHTAVVMNQTGSIETTVGKEYQIVEVNSKDIGIVNDNNHPHTFGIQKDSNSYYGKWFTLIPQDIKNIDFFKNLYESKIGYEYHVIKFNPPISDSETMSGVLKFLGTTYPGLRWSEGENLMDFEPIPKFSTKVYVLTVRVDRNSLTWSSSNSVCKPDRYTKCIDGYELLSTKFNPDDAFNKLNESDDDLNWAKDVVKGYDNPDDYELVIVTHPGECYSSYLDAMAQLGVPKAEDYLRERISGDLDRDSRFYTRLMRKEGILGNPEEGDICYLVPRSFVHESYEEEIIHHLIRINDGKHFIMNQNGFKLYNVNLNEQDDNLEWAKQSLSDIKIPYGYAIDMCDVDNDTRNKVFDKLERDGYDKSRISEYRNGSYFKGRGMIVYLGSNYIRDNWEHGLEFDHCRIKEKFVDGVMKRDSGMTQKPFKIGEYKLISSKDFLGI